MNTDPVFDAERILMIDDMKLTADNEFKKGNRFQRWVERHDGREGDTILINGKENTVLLSMRGKQKDGALLMHRAQNILRLYFGGKTFKIIGTDGGLLEKPQNVTEVLMIPGERIDIVVGPFIEGENFSIESLPYNRTTFVKTKIVQLATVMVGDEKPSVAFLPSNLREIEPLAPQDAAVTRKIKFAVDINLKHGVDFFVNGGTHYSDKPVNVGELQVWEVSNYKPNGSSLPFTWIFFPGDRRKREGTCL